MPILSLLVKRTAKWNAATSARISATRHYCSGLFSHSSYSVPTSSDLDGQSLDGQHLNVQHSVDQCWSVRSRDSRPMKIRDGL